MNYFPMAQERRLSFALAAVALLASGAPARAESPAGEWRQTVFLYGIVATIDGDAQVGPPQVPVVAESGSVSCKPSEDRS